APPGGRPAPVPPPARRRSRSCLRGRGAAGRTRPDAAAGHPGSGVADRVGAGPARGDDRARRATALTVTAVAVSAARPRASASAAHRAIALEQQPQREADLRRVVSATTASVRGGG